MRLVRVAVLSASVFAMSAAGASPVEEKTGKDELMALYLLSVAAERCGFALTSRQADAIERETRARAEKLKLRQRENDAIYSEADVAFEKQGRAACDRSGAFAKGFRQTLQRMIGP